MFYQALWKERKRKNKHFIGLSTCHANTILTKKIGEQRKKTPSASGTCHIYIHTSNSKSRRRRRKVPSAWARSHTRILIKKKAKKIGKTVLLGMYQEMLTGSPSFHLAMPSEHLKHQLLHNVCMIRLRACNNWIGVGNNVHDTIAFYQCVTVLLRPN